MVLWILLAGWLTSGAASAWYLRTWSVPVIAAGPLAGLGGWLIWMATGAIDEENMPAYKDWLVWIVYAAIVVAVYAGCALVA